MATTRGYGGTLGAGLETTFGTAVSRTTWAHAYAMALREMTVVEPIGVLQEHNHSDVARDHITRKDVSGSVEIPLCYESLGLWLTILMGDEPTTGGSDPYTHTWNRSPAFAESLTVEQVRGSSGRSEVFSGVKAAGGSIVVRAADIVRLNLDLVGYAAAARDAAGTPSFSSDVGALAVYSRHADNITGGAKAAEFSFNGANYSFQDLEIQVTNNITDTGDVTSDFYVAALDQSDQGEIIVRATILERGSATEALFTAHKAATESDVVITFTGPGDFAMSVTARNCRVISFEDPISGTGRVPIRVEFRAKPDASDGALTIAVTNNDSAYGTN
jgi:hypothetical protein